MMLPRPLLQAGCVLALWHVTAPAHAAGAAPAPASSAHAPSVLPLSVEASVALALPLHPAVLQSRAELARAQGEAARATALLHNPTASVQASLDGARAGGSLSQPVSLTGERLSARRVALAEVAAAEQRLERARLVAAAEVRGAYVDAIVQRGRVAIARDGVAIAERLRDAVALQHNEGEAALLDLRLARLSLVQAASRLLETQRAEVSALRKLAALIGRPVAGEQLPAEPLAASPWTTATVPPERTDVRAAEQLLRAAEANLTRQRAASWSPVSVGAFVELEDERAFAGPMVSVQLPLFDRNQADRGAARGAVEVRRADHARMVAVTITEQETARARAKEAAVLEGTLGVDPLEEARSALASIEAGYRAGQIDLPSTVLLQNQVLTGEAAALSLLGSIARARIDLLLACDDHRLLDTATSDGGER